MAAVCSSSANRARFFSCFKIVSFFRFWLTRNWNKMVDHSISGDSTSKFEILRFCEFPTATWHLRAMYLDWLQWDEHGWDNRITIGESSHHWITIGYQWYQNISNAYWIFAAQMHAASSPDHARSPGKRERRTPHVISLTVFKIFGDLKVHPRIVPLSRCTNKRISVLSPFAAKIDGPLDNITIHYISARYTCIHVISSHGKHLWAWSNHIYSLHAKDYDYDIIFSMPSVTGFKVCDLAVEARERREEGRSDPWMCHCHTKMLGIQGDSKIENT